MKTSELIKELQDKMNKYGDQLVFVEDDGEESESAGLMVFYETKGDEELGIPYLPTRFFIKS